MKKLQQGDVIIRSVDNIPEGARRISRAMRGFVLAIGEATGHAHVVEEDMEMYEKDGVLYIKVDKPVTVKHEEHKPVVISQGTYAVGYVRECDPFAEVTLVRRELSKEQASFTSEPSNELAYLKIKARRVKD